MAWTFSGVFLDGLGGDRVVAGTGEPEELPGRYALAGLVDAHAHPTVAADGQGPYLADSAYGAARLAEYTASGVTVIRDAGGRGQVTLGFARAGIGADSIEHGRALGHAEVETLGARGGAWTPTLCAMLQNRDSTDPDVRNRVTELRERLRDCLPHAIAHGVRVLAGTDVVGTIAEEIALLADHGLTVGQAIAAAGSAARDFLGIHPAGDIVTYDDDPREDPGVLARPAAVVIRGLRVR